MQAPHPQGYRVAPGMPREPSRLMYPQGLPSVCRRSSCDRGARILWCVLLVLTRTCRRQVRALVHLVHVTKHMGRHPRASARQLPPQHPPDRSRMPPAISRSNPGISPQDAKRVKRFRLLPTAAGRDKRGANLRETQGTVGNFRDKTGTLRPENP